jgi:hypothetical protein
MTTTNRQNNLLLNQDWKRIYQTFKTADFKSYDFENLRRVIITYLRENYPEDFNDYIESSEYLALIDAIAFVGQSLSFRIDLASRENFIELAETKESVLRLARLLSYNAKRNLAAEGLLKFDTITTTEGVLDSNGKNLAQQVIIWNDPTNPNWFEQFILILNSAMSDSVEFGRSEASAVIQGVQCDQYRFRSRFSDVPLFSFDKPVANRRAPFELVSTSFKNSNKFYEEPPFPGREMGYIYKQDGKGPGSSNTGFFLLLKQGSLEVTDFSIDVPTTNEIVSIDVANINDTDVWMYSLDQNGNQTDQWTRVPSLFGNNIAYNSIRAGERNIFNVVTKQQDKIDLVFADGVYGNLPKGSFRTYYRVSNGQEYSITPAEMKGINISVPYFNAQGAAHELTISCGLKYTISNSAKSEDIDSVRSRAPAIYYTQNRMITGEDYNLAPLGSSQDILKVKAINRTSSGISRNFDIIDASGKYSNVNVFGSDGLIYREDTETVLSFKYTNRAEAINFVRDRIEPILSSTEIYNFYLTKFEKIVFTDETVRWNKVTDDVNQCTGYFFSSVDNGVIRVGNYTNNSLKYVSSGSLIKFVPPEGMRFRLGQLVDADPLDPLQTDRLWTKAVKITGDGTNAGRGVLANGLGPIVFNDVIPTGAIASRIVPRFITNLPTPFELEMINLITSDLNFGLRYDILTSSWKIITASNLNLIDFFSVGTTGDITNVNLDTSWIIAFVKDVDGYKVRIRGLDYIFRSREETRFYYDAAQKSYDSRTGKVIKDQVKLLGINTDSGLINPLKTDLVFEVSDSIKSEDGYTSANEIKVTFSDSDDDGIIDNPESFDLMVSEVPDFRFLFFIKKIDRYGAVSFEYVDNPNNSVIKVASSINSVLISSYRDNDLVYFYAESENRVMQVVNNGTAKVFVYRPEYKAAVGRPDLKFHYIHNANVDRRIDPSVSNIIDVYLLTRNYDTEYRSYLSGQTTVKPEPPTSEALKIAYGTNLDLIKSISDEIIYYPVNYKVLFGSDADPNLRVSFKVVKNPNKTVNDNDLKVRIINAINVFFDVNNWDFGDRFYLGELITYITNQVSPDISNLVIVPRQPNQVFGSLFEIQSGPDEIFVSGARVDDIEIVNAITAVEIRSSTESTNNMN